METGRKSRGRTKTEQDGRFKSDINQQGILSTGPAEATFNCAEIKDGSRALIPARFSAGLDGTD